MKSTSLKIHHQNQEEMKLALSYHLYSNNNYSMTYRLESWATQRLAAYAHKAQRKNARGCSAALQWMHQTNGACRSLNQSTTDTQEYSRLIRNSCLLFHKPKSIRISVALTMQPYTASGRSGDDPWAKKFEGFHGTCTALKLMLNRAHLNPNKHAPSSCL